MELNWEEISEQGRAVAAGKAVENVTVEQAEAIKEFVNWYYPMFMVVGIQETSISKDNEKPCRVLRIDDN